MIQPAPAFATAGAAGSLTLDSALTKRTAEAPSTGSGVVPATPGGTGQPTSFATPVAKGSTVGSSQGVSVNLGSGASVPAKVPDIPKDLPWGKPTTVSQASTPGGRTARVTFVGDGDGVTGQFGDGSNVTCRLNNIDAPEVKHDARTTKTGTQLQASPDQSYGRESQKSLEDLIMNKEVTIKVTQVKDGRSYCDVEFQGKDLSMRQVEQGLAMVYARYVDPARKAAFQSAEDKAKSQRLNLWNDANPLLGERFRRQYN